MHKNMQKNTLLQISLQILIFTTSIQNIRAEKSIGIIYFQSIYKKYNYQRINKMIAQIEERYNHGIDDMNSVILSEVNKSLDTLREKPTGSAFWNFIAKSARDEKVEIKFFIDPQGLKFHFDEKKFNIKSADHNYGALLEFSTDHKNRIGTHIFLTNIPGIDIFYARKMNKMQLALGLGMEFLIHDIEYDKHDISLPYMALFGIIKTDYYLGQEIKTEIKAERSAFAKIFVMYKFSQWPIIGHNHSVGIGISALIK